MSWLRRILYAVMFFVGFLTASHWDFGRELVQEQSPLYKKKVLSLGNQIKHEVEKSLKVLKKK